MQRLLVTFPLKKRRENVLTVLPFYVNLVLLINRIFIPVDLFLANSEKMRKYVRSKMICYKSLLPEGCTVKIAFRIKCRV